MPGIASPLEGVKVLDFTQGVSGPLATKFMGAMGANVIKVEPPGVGDLARSHPPFLNDEPHPEKSGKFLYLNTNKRSITLDVEQPAARHIARKLVAWADVVIENYAPGQMAEWGLGYGDLEAIRPGIILVSVSRFGQTGPYRDFKGNEIVSQALGGLLYFTGDPSREPLRIGGEPAEHFAGLSAFSGALVALTYAEVTGTGQHVDVSEVEGVATAQMYSALSYVYTGAGRERSAQGPLYRAEDGLVGVGFRQPEWVTLANMMGRPELIEDERFKDIPSRRTNNDQLAPIIGEWIAPQKKQDLYHKAQQAGMTWGYICDTKDLMDSPQYQHRQYFIEIDHPVAGKLTYPGMPLKWGDATWDIRRAPLLGEHNGEVYGELLGWSTEDVVQMRASGVI